MECEGRERARLCAWGSQGRFGGRRGLGWMGSGEEGLHLAQLDAAIAEGAGDGAEEEGGPGADEAGGGGDCGETCDEADAAADEGGLAEMDPLDSRPGAHGGGGGDGGVDDGEDGLASAAESRAAVETEPAEPEHAGAEGDKGAVVGDVHSETLLLRKT